MKLNRFYAGVPITTPKGINIGAYCILDDNVRNGISDKDVTFLRDMAATVMTHLDMVRAKAEHQRGTRMVTGLGAFVEGASNFHEWEARNSHRDRQLMTSSRLPDIKTATAVKISEETESTIKEKSNIGSMTATPLNNLQVALEKSLETDRVPRVTVQSPKPSQKSARHSPKPPEPPERTPSASPVDSKLSQTKHIEDLQEETLTANVRTTFQRAARLMREAVDVDGSLFLDASVARFGGLVQGPELPSGSEHNSSSEGVATTTDNATDLDEGLTMSERMGCNDHKPCSILGASSSADRDTSFSNSPDRGPAAKEITVSETFLRSLLRRVSCNLPSLPQIHHANYRSTNTARSGTLAKTATHRMTVRRRRTQADGDPNYTSRHRGREQTRRRAVLTRASLVENGVDVLALATLGRYNDSFPECEV